MGPLSLRGRRLVQAVAVALFLVVSPAGVAHAAPGDQLWMRCYNGPGSGHDAASSLAVSDSLARVFVTGYSKGHAGTGTSDVATVAYNSGTGAFVWRSRYNGPANGADGAGYREGAIAVSPNGMKVFVTGHSFGGSATNLDFVTIAYNGSTGQQLWASRYDGPAHGDDEARQIAVSSDGKIVVVTGYSPGVGTGNDYATVAYDVTAGGAQLWVKRYDGPPSGADEATAVVVSPNDEVFVSGSSEAATGSNTDFLTISYDLLTGGTNWIQRYNGPWNADDIARDLASTSNGSTVFATGVVGGSPGGAATVAYDASTPSGASIWTDIYSGPVSGTELSSSITTSPNGNGVYVTGESDGGMTSADYTTIAYDPSSGSTLWNPPDRRFQGPGASYDAAQSVAVSKGGKLYVTGTGEGTTTALDIVTVSYRAGDGSQRWASRFDAGSTQLPNEFGTAVAIRRQAKMVYVTGEGNCRAGYDYVTIAYRW